MPQQRKQPLITAAQRELLLAACELLGADLTILKERLRKPSLRQGAEAELVALFAGMTVGEATPQGSDTFDIVWKLVSGTSLCVEVTHVQPTGPYRALRYLEFRRAIELQLEARGISSPWNIRIQVVGLRGQARPGDRKDWPRLFASSEFDQFCREVAESGGGNGRWSDQNGRFLVLAAGSEPFHTKHPKELILDVTSHPLYRGIAKKATQLAKSKLDDRPTLVVLCATEAVEDFSKFTMFRGDVAGPCRSAFGGLGSGPFGVHAGKLVQEGIVRNHRKVSAAKLVLPGKPSFIEFPHQTNMVVENGRAEVPLSRADLQLVAMAVFVTWRFPPRLSVEHYVALAHNRRDTLSFGILPDRIRYYATDHVYFGMPLEGGPEVLPAVVLAFELKRRGASVSSERYLRLPEPWP